MRQLTPIALIVEDNLLTEVELEQALGAEGCRYVVAGDETVALRTLDVERPDLAVVDLDIPHGVSLARTIIDRDVPLVACADQPADRVLEALGSRRPAAVLAKPIRLKAAVEAIRRALAAPAPSVRGRAIGRP